MFLPKFQGGGQRFQEKLPGWSTYFVFFAFLLTSFSKICLGGCCFIPPPPLCASMTHACNVVNQFLKLLNNVEQCLALLLVVSQCFENPI
jgi:hypothetical protein